jgi:hypothetical protein
MPSSLCMIDRMDNLIDGTCKCEAPARTINQGHIPPKPKSLNFLAMAQLPCYNQTCPGVATWSQRKVGKPHFFAS